MLVRDCDDQMVFPVVSSKGVRSNMIGKTREQSSPLRVPGTSVNARTVEGSTALAAVAMTVSPGQADIWLNSFRNPTNRNEPDADVDRLAAEMSSGAWVLTHQGIAFGHNRLLHDGHHRLKACVRAGVPFDTVVYLYLGKQASDGALKNIDTNSPRTLPARLTLDGCVTRDQAPAYAAVINMIDLICLWDVGKNVNRRITITRAREILTYYGDSIAWAVDTLPARQFLSDGRAAFAVAHRAAPDEVKSLALVVRDRVSLGKASGAAYKIDSILRPKVAVGKKIEHGTGDRFAKALQILHAIRARVDGKAVQPFKRDGLFEFFGIKRDVE